MFKLKIEIDIKYVCKGSVTGHYTTNSLSQTDWTETFIVHIPEVNIYYLIYTYGNHIGTINPRPDVSLIQLIPPSYY